MARYFLYNLLLSVMAPVVAIFLLFNRESRPLLRRFYPLVPPGDGMKRIWIHACSVGEVLASKSLVKALKEAHPEARVLLSVSTVSGYTLAVGNLPDVEATFAPFDLRWCVRSFVRRLSPAVLVLMETEVWPNLVRETRRMGVQVVIANGRISPRKYPVYKKYKSLLPPVFSWISHAAVQEEIYGERFQFLGVNEEKVTVTGNMKCDGVITEISEERKRELRSGTGFGEDDRIIIFGSTRPGDEELAFSCWEKIKDEYENIKLIIAPRHLQRLKEGLSAFAGEDVILRSSIKAGGRVTKERVLFLDTMGELNSFYAICHIAVIGGSFFPGVEGHNPLEPAALGIPTVFGFFMGNFPDAAALLLNRDGAVQVAAPEELLPRLKYLLEHPGEGEAIGKAGRLAVLDSQGATARTAALIERFMRWE